MIQMFSSKQMEELEKLVINSPEYIETACLALAKDEKTCELHRRLEKSDKTDLLAANAALVFLPPNSNTILLRNLLLLTESLCFRES